MADLANIPKQSNFETSLASPINSSQTTGITLNAVPDYTPGGETVRLTIINPKGVEQITCTGWNSTTKILSGVTRGVALYTGGPSSARAHAGGIKVIMGNPWDLYNDILTAINAKVDTAGDTMSGLLQFSGTDHAGIQLISLTTAERDAIASPAEGMIIYNETTGVNNQYISGAWTDFASGTTSNASETVAGKVEEGTQTETDDGDETGDTGAKIFATPKKIAKSIQDSKWSFAEDAEASDAYAITLSPAPTAYATGQRFTFTANTANTGAATLNVNTLGSKAIKKNHDQDLATGDIESGQVVEVVYDGTNMQMVSATAALVPATPLKIGSDSWSVTGSAQTETVAHGLGRVPRLLTIYWGVTTGGSDSGDLPHGTLMYDGTNHHCFQRISASSGSAQFEKGTTLRVLKDGSVYWTATVTTLDDTNFVLTSANFATGEAIDYTWKVE
jgi:hypothetical protein